MRVFSLFWPKKVHFQANSYSFLTFLWINFLVGMLQNVWKLQFCICFAHENMKTPSKGYFIIKKLQKFSVLPASPNLKFCSLHDLYTNDFECGTADESCNPTPPVSSMPWQQLEWLLCNNLFWTGVFLVPLSRIFVVVVFLVKFGFSEILIWKNLALILMLPSKSQNKWKFFFK